MLSLVLRAYWNLIWIDLYIIRDNFAGLCEQVRRCEIRKESARKGRQLEKVCSAVDIACVLYYKQVLCLQRSAAATRLLKRSGIPAEMVIGTQLKPFKAHAWVEVDGKVVIDKPYIPQDYLVIDRC